MNTQARMFKLSEGDAWFERNQDKLGKNDPVMEILKQCEFIKPKSVLEIGCSNGWRLIEIQKHYKCAVYGIDPSSEAVENGIEHGLWLEWSTADQISFRASSFDLVIFGFCLYLVDREDLFKAVSEADRLLQDNGYLVIYDFLPSPTPYKIKYKHKPGLWSYHMDYSKLFLANPAYKSVISYVPHSAHGEPATLVTLLQKRMELAYPEGEP